MNKLLIEICAATIIALLAAPAHADCAGYKWDVSRAQALYAGVPVSIAAANDAAAAPKVLPDKFYEVTLLDQSKVTFAVAPGKKMQSGAYGGTVAFTVPKTAAYLIGVDQPLWIDVVADGKLTPTKDFHGQRECEGPRKIVEFELTAGRRYLLQFSGGTQRAVKVTVIPSLPKT